MLKNKHLSTVAKNASILSRLTDLIDNIYDDTVINKETEDDPLPLTNNYSINVPNMNKSPVFTCAKPVVICIYQIRNDGLYPFLLFLLSTTLNFIAMPSFDGGKHNKHIKKDAMAYIHRLLPGANVAYEGFYSGLTQNIVIMSYKSRELDAPTNFVWCTPHELINVKKVMNSRVHKNVIDFFSENRDFLVIKDEYNSIYESPMIGYYCSNEELDIYREVRIPELGKCYYLSVELPSPSKKPNIIRAVFFQQQLGLDYTKKYATVLASVEGKDYYILNNYNQQTTLSLV